MRLKAKITFEWEYEADPEGYETDDPVQAARNETKWLKDGSKSLLEFIDLCINKPKIEITPVLEKEKMKEILLKFCGADNEKTQRPFSLGDYTYATDGVVLIRVPRMSEFPENPLAPDPKKIKYKESREWHLVTDIEMPKTEECEKGTRRIPRRNPMNFHGILFDQKYLALLSQLPDCKIGKNPPGEIAPFRFSGGTGLLMSMRYREEL